MIEALIDAIDPLGISKAYEMDPNMLSRTAHVIGSSKSVFVAFADLPPAQALIEYLDGPQIEAIVRDPDTAQRLNTSAGSRVTYRPHRSLEVQKAIELAAPSTYVLALPDIGSSELEKLKPFIREGIKSAAVHCRHYVVSGPSGIADTFRGQLKKLYKGTETYRVADSEILRATNSLVR